MKINCSVITPEKILFEGEVDFTAVQIHDGEAGFLINHTPFIAELGYGEARLKTADKTDYIVVDGGFLEVRDNQIVILAEGAVNKEDLPSGDELKAEYQETFDKSLKERDENEKFRLEIELKKLKTRLKVSARE